MDYFAIALEPRQALERFTVIPYKRGHGNVKCLVKTEFAFQLIRGRGSDEIKPLYVLQKPTDRSLRKLFFVV